jgi:hypothetical protein
VKFVPTLRRLMGGQLRGRKDDDVLALLNGDARNEFSRSSDICRFEQLLCAQCRAPALIM